MAPFRPYRGRMVAGLRRAVPSASLDKSSVIQFDYPAIVPEPRSDCQTGVPKARCRPDKPIRKKTAMANLCGRSVAGECR